MKHTVLPRKLRLPYVAGAATIGAVLAAGGIAATSSGGSGPASTVRPAGAVQALSTHYTHSTTLKKSSCPIYENYPKPGVPARSWTKSRGSAKHRTHVGVRYTYRGYALVLDYAHKTDPSWGFIARSCLTDSYAYSGGDHGTRLPDLRAIGGNGQVKAVPISAPHAGRSQKATIHLGSNGSLRSGSRSFVIGNARQGDTFNITTAHCGHHSASAWILGYAPNSGRWGYIQAAHLPACR